MRFVLAFFMILLLPQLAVAQGRIPSHCQAVADASPELQFLQTASYGAPLDSARVRIHYVAHASFAIETAGGLLAVTDYAGFIGDADIVPDVVTMNIAHETHNTAFPDPRIPHVLKGWNPKGGPAVHRLDLGEMLVRNVTSNIRDGFGGAIRDGNSIFIFEVAGLCIGHLGHLHHEPADETYVALGRLDVVMAPVDGGRTLDIPTLIQVLGRLKSSIVLPMHWFSDGGLGGFTAGMRDDFDVVELGDSFIEISLHSLPKRPTVMVLRPRYLQQP